MGNTQKWRKKEEKYGYKTKKEKIESADLNKGTNEMKQEKGKK